MQPQLLKTGEQPALGKIGAGEKQGGDCRNRRVVEVQAVDQVEKDRDGETDQKEAVTEEAAGLAAIDCRADHLRNLEQRKVHLFVVDPLPGDDVDQKKHHQVAEQDKATPEQQRGKPGRPGNCQDHLNPRHAPPSGEPVVEQFNGLVVGWGKGRWNEWGNDFIPAVAGAGKVDRCGKIDQKGSGKASVGDARGDHHLDPHHQQFGTGKQ